jgi:hypothetical protein
MKSLKFIAACLIVSMSAGAADTPVPTADVAGVKDPAYLGRFAGSKALTYTASDFDSLTLPLSALAAVPGQRDGSNNQVFAPTKKLALEGRRAHLVYLLPEGTAPLAAIRNYQNAAAAKGGKTLFELTVDVVAAAVAAGEGHREPGGRRRILNRHEKGIAVGGPEHAPIGGEEVAGRACVALEPA